MEHKKVTNRSAGAVLWKTACSCGRVWVGWRWLVEEQCQEHILWHVAESYPRHQRCGDTYMDEADDLLPQCRHH